jgi:hypothetical protein
MMSSAIMTTEAAKATFSFWQSGSNGATLASHAGDITKSVAPGDPLDYLQVAADVVATVDSLISPVVELAQVSTGSVLAGAKVLSKIGVVASLASFTADTIKLKQKLSNPKATITEKGFPYHFRPK